ncbi:hypothetical protein FKM82_015840 [Ascaphus truei]
MTSHTDVRFASDAFSRSAYQASGGTDNHDPIVSSALEAAHGAIGWCCHCQRQWSHTGWLGNMTRSMAPKLATVRSTCGSIYR